MGKQRNYEKAMTRGREALNAGNLDEAISSFRIALQNKPSDPEARNGLAAAQTQSKSSLPTSSEPAPSGEENSHLDSAELKAAIDGKTLEKLTEEIGKIQIEKQELRSRIQATESATEKRYKFIAAVAAPVVGTVLAFLGAYVGLWQNQKVLQQIRIEHDQADGAKQKAKSILAEAEKARQIREDRVVLQENVEQVERLLGTTDPKLLAAAIRKTGEFKKEHAGSLGPKLIRLFAHNPRTPEDWDLEEQLSDTLVAIGQEQLESDLVFFIKTSSQPGTIKATETLGGLRTAVSIEAMFDLLANSPDPRIRGVCLAFLTRAGASKLARKAINDLKKGDADSLHLFLDLVPLLSPADRADPEITSALLALAKTGRLTSVKSFLSPTISERASLNLLGNYVVRGSIQDLGNIVTGPESQDADATKAVTGYFNTERICAALVVVNGSPRPSKDWIRSKEYLLTFESRSQFETNMIHVAAQYCISKHNLRDVGIEILKKDLAGGYVPRKRTPVRAPKGKSSDGPGPVEDYRGGLPSQWPWFLDIDPQSVTIPKNEIMAMVQDPKLSRDTLAFLLSLLMHDDPGSVENFIQSAIPRPSISPLQMAVIRAHHKDKRKRIEAMVADMHTMPALGAGSFGSEQVFFCWYLVRLIELREEPIIEKALEETRFLARWYRYISIVPESSRAPWIQLEGKKILQDLETQLKTLPANLVPIERIGVDSLRMLLSTDVTSSESRIRLRAIEESIYNTTLSSLAATPPFFLALVDDGWPLVEPAPPLTTRLIMDRKAYERFVGWRVRVRNRLG